MTKRGWALGASLALVMLAGCGDSGGGSSSADMGGPKEDGGVPPGGDAGCPPPSGEGEIGQILHTLVVAPAGKGFDLDGNGSVDNRLSVLSLANQVLADNINSGVLLLGMQIRELDDPITDSMVEVVVYNVTDGDDATCNNFDGEGRFKIRSSSLDEMGDAKFKARGTISQGQMTVVTEDPLTFRGESIVATLQRPRLIASLAPDGASITDGIIGGVVQACDLTKIDPMLGTGNTLDTLVMLGTLPDVDFNANGIDTFELDPATGKVNRCTTGDGQVIDGPECPCDPRITDGYSVAFKFSTLPGVLIF